MSGLKVLVAAVVVIFASLIFVQYAQPQATLIEKPHYVPLDLPNIHDSSSICQVLECFYLRNNQTGKIGLYFYWPQYEVAVNYSRTGALLTLSILTMSFIALAAASSKLEHVSTKKAVAAVGMVYAAAIALLTFIRRDFRTAAPILAPIAGAVFAASLLLFAMVRLSGHRVEFREIRGRVRHRWS